jgi:hypothetical protein
MGHTLTLNRTTRESGECYAEALVEACSKAGVADPVKVLTDTDDYPQVTREVEMAEFLVGWFHGVADSLGVQLEALWEAVAGDAQPAPPPPPKARKPRKAKPKAKAKAKPKAKPRSKPAPAPADPPAKAPAKPRSKPAAKPATDAQAIEEALAGCSDEEQAAQAKAMIEALRKRREAVREGSRA